MNRVTNTYRIFGCLFTILAAVVCTAAQAPISREQQLFNEATDRWWYTMFFIAVSGGGLALYSWIKIKKRAGKPTYQYTVDTSAPRTDQAATDLESLRKAYDPSRKTKKSEPDPAHKMVADDDLDTRIFQERMRKMQYDRLPINYFDDLSPARQYEPLTVSDDPALLSAIEQTNDDIDDEAVRDIALRVLTAFRNKNSVDALSQIALYDVTATLRSKAVGALSDFDHESVFETILLACADPTREVRAAAARGLFRLNFDRADGWKRIIETKDVFRMRHAARAAVESGIVSKSFDRLIHEDTKVAYEAFALVSMLVHAGEIQDIFTCLKTHKDERVKFALLHVLQVSRDDRALKRLKEMSLDQSFTSDVADRIRAAITNSDPVGA